MATTALLCESDGSDKTALFFLPDLELVVLTGPLAARRFHVGGDGATLGQEGDIALPGLGLSRHHARVAYREGRFHVSDLGSRNGTFVNRRRVDGEVALEPRDVLRLGDTHLRVLIGDGFDEGRADDTLEPAIFVEESAIVEEAGAPVAATSVATPPERRGWLRYGASAVGIACAMVCVVPAAHRGAQASSVPSLTAVSSSVGSSRSTSSARSAPPPARVPVAYGAPAPSPSLATPRAPVAAAASPPRVTVPVGAPAAPPVTPTAAVAAPAHHHHHGHTGLRSDGAVRLLVARDDLATLRDLQAQAQAAYKQALDEHRDLLADGVTGDELAASNATVAETRRRAHALYRLIDGR